MLLINKRKEKEMNQVYSIYDMPQIIFDDELTIEELISFAYKKVHCYEPAGLDIVTLFDIVDKRVLDKKKKCKDEINKNSKLYLTYIMKDKFFFIEGGWGQALMEEIGYYYIEEVTSIRFHLEDLEGVVALNYNLPLEDIYNYLLKLTYIGKEQTVFVIKELPAYRIYNSRTEKFYLPKDNQIRLFDAKQGFLDLKHKKLKGILLTFRL